MKALSLTRPYGTLAILGEKIWETRPRRPSHIGETAIHVPQGFPKNLLKLFPGGLSEVCNAPFFKEALARHGYVEPDDLPVGSIIGLVDIIRFERTEVMRASLSQKELAFGLYSDGRWAYELANPRPVKPIQCGGALGFWNVPAAIVERINEQLR